MAARGVAEHQKYQDIGGGQHDTCPEREFWEQETQANGRPEKLCQIGGYDGNFCEDIEGV